MSLAPGGCRSDPRTWRQHWQREEPVVPRTTWCHHQRVPRIGAWKNAGQSYATWKWGFQILQTMDSEIDSSIEQRGVKFLREEPFASRLSEVPIQDAIPACRDRGNVETNLMTGRLEGRENKARLPECKR